MPARLMQKPGSVRPSSISKKYQIFLNIQLKHLKKYLHIYGIIMQRNYRIQKYPVTIIVTTLMIS